MAPFPRLVVALFFATFAGAQAGPIGTRAYDTLEELRGDLPSALAGISRCVGVALDPDNKLSGVLADEPARIPTWPIHVPLEAIDGVGRRYAGAYVRLRTALYGQKGLLGRRRKPRR